MSTTAPTKQPAADDLPRVSQEQITVDVNNLDLNRAAELYREHGCLVVRGLMKPYLEGISRDIEQVIEETIALIPEAVEKPGIGFGTPNGSLLLPAPEGFHRDKQIMTLPINYRNSATFLRSALDETTLDLVEAVLGPDLELFMEGQSLVKEPVGGHPKNLHQDAAYFEHRFEGPMAMISATVDTDLNNGAFHVVPGSHKLGVLNHEDTFSHLGLSEQAWPWEKALPIIAEAGDAVFFHVNCIHGSQPNWSDKPRPVFINRYRRADDYIVIHGATTAAREEAEKAKDQARKDNQLGLMVRGRRKFDPNRFQ